MTEEIRIETRDPEVARAEIERTRERMSETLDEIEESIAEKKDWLREQLDIGARIREKPLHAAGIVLGAGVLLGLVTGGGRRVSSRELEAAAARGAVWEGRARRLLDIARSQEEEIERLRDGEEEEYEEEAAAEEDLEALPVGRSGRRRWWWSRRDGGGRDYASEDEVDVDVDEDGDGYVDLDGEADAYDYYTDPLDDYGYDPDDAGEELFEEDLLYDREEVPRSGSRRFPGLGGRPQPFLARGGFSSRPHSRGRSGFAKLRDAVVHQVVEFLADHDLGGIRRSRRRR